MLIKFYIRALFNFNVYCFKNKTQKADVCKTATVLYGNRPTTFFAEHEGQDPVRHKKGLASAFRQVLLFSLHRAASGAYWAGALSERVALKASVSPLRKPPPMKFSLTVPSLRSTFLPWLLLKMPGRAGETLLSSFRWQSMLPHEVATTVTRIQVSFLGLTSALPAPDKAVALHRNLLHNLQGRVQSGNAEPLAQIL